MDKYAGELKRNDEVRLMVDTVRREFRVIRKVEMSTGKRCGVKVGLDLEDIKSHKLMYIERGQFTPLQVTKEA